MLILELVWSCDCILIQRVLSRNLSLIIIIIIYSVVIFIETVNSAIHDIAFRIVAVFLHLTKTKLGRNLWACF
jgi:hypothetical protein